MISYLLTDVFLLIINGRSYKISIRIQCGTANETYKDAVNINSNIRLQDV